MPSKINWGERARLHIARFTKKQTPAQAVRYFMQLTEGDVAIIQMVAQAMKEAFEEGAKMERKKINVTELNSK